MKAFVIPLLSLLAEFAGAAVLGYAVVGTVWLISGRMRPFPRKAVYAFAFTGLLIGVARNLPEFQTAFQTQGAAGEVKKLTAIYQAALSGEASREGIRAVVQNLNVKAWPPDLVQYIVAVMGLKAERYADLLQSSYLGSVVRSPWPASVPSAVQQQLSGSDDQWTPLLETAAQGKPVTLPSGDEIGPFEMWVLSLMARWARYETLTALVEESDVVLSLAPEERVTGEALAWLPIVFFSLEDEAVASGNFQSLQTAQRFFDLTLDFNRALDLLGGGTAARAFSSYMNFHYLGATVDLESSLGIVRFVLDGDDSTDWDVINRKRRALGMPVMIVPQDLDSAARSGILPWQVDGAGQKISPEARIAMESELASLVGRWARVPGSPVAGR